MSTQHISKRTKLNDDSPQIIISGYRRSVDVPNNVTHVQFHHSVTKIDNETFKGCSQLREVILNEGLREIGEEAFADCTSLERIVFPSTIVEIDDNAFSGCTRLREVVLNEGITKIGKQAFHGCSSLEGIILPSTLTEISVGSFKDCTSLREMSIHNEDMKIGDNALHWTTTEVQNRLVPSLALERIKFPSITTRLDVIKNENEDEANEIIKVIDFICKHGGGPSANINMLMR